MAFTTSERKEEVEIEYSRLSTEEIPMASFVAIEGNEKFLTYIRENVDR